MFDLKAREQGHIVLVALDPWQVVGHDHGHERLGLLKNIVGIDEDFADIGLEVVADRANHQARFQVNQQRR